MRKATGATPKGRGSAAVSALPRDAGWEQHLSLTLFWCLLSLLVPRAMLYAQLAPFGISLAAAAGNLPVTVAVLGGYLLAEEVLMPLRYIAAVLAVAGGHWVLAVLPEFRRRPFVPSLLAFGGAAVTGLVLLGQTGLDGWRVLLILSESVVAAAGALFFRVTMDFTKSCAAAAVQGKRQPMLATGQQVAVIFTGAVAVMATSSLRLGGFSFGWMLAALLVLILGRSGRETGGCIAGVILATAMAMGNPTQTAAAMALAIGGLAAGVFSRFGRLAEALTFFVSAGILLLGQVDEESVMRLYEMLAACGLLALLPKSWDRWLCHLFLHGREWPAVEGLRRAVALRLAVASKAMTEVSDTVETVSAHLSRHGAADAAGLFRGCYEAVCNSCPLRALCWEQNREETMAALEATLSTLRKQGEIAPKELTGWLSQQCRQKERLVGYLTRGYERMTAQEGAWQRLAELQASLCGQLSATGGLLADLAQDMEQPDRVDTDLSGRILTVCRDHGMSVRDALCVRGTGNRLIVDILAANSTGYPTGGRWLREICEACGRSFAPPMITACGEDTRLTLTEQPRYRVESAVAQRCHGGEKLCGDAVNQFSYRGQTVLMLSDGMGSGGRAAVDGAMTVGLAARLWQGGFSPNGVLQTVNASLLVKSREESLATLDVMLIDEFSGGLDSYKAGAAASLLYSGGRVSRIERPSLPVGILPEVCFEHSRDRLVPGDILLMMSDGALSDGLAAVEEQLRIFPADGDMSQLAESIADSAQKAQTAHQDDITVIAMRLCKNTV